MALLPVNATGFCSFIRSPYKGIRPGVIYRSTGPGGSAPAGTVSNPLPKPCHERRLGKHPPLRASRKSHFTPLLTGVMRPRRRVQAGRFQVSMSPTTSPRRCILEWMLHWIPVIFLSVRHSC